MDFNILPGLKPCLLYVCGLQVRVIGSHRRDFFRRYRKQTYSAHYSKPNDGPSWKRRKFSSSAWGDCGRQYLPANIYVSAPSTFSKSAIPTTSNAEASTSTSCKRERSKLDDDEPVFLSRDEIERLSPSRKDGIDVLRDTHLRPQTTIGTAMVPCHRFFVRQSHACHDRILVATAALFLAAKSEETPRPLNNVLRACCKILHKHDMTSMSFLLPVNWFEQYREQVTESEQMILVILNFELDVQHPYVPLTSVLNKLGLSQSLLVNLALNIVSEGRGTAIDGALLA